MTAPVSRLTTRNALEAREIGTVPEGGKEPTAAAGKGGAEKGASQCVAGRVESLVRDGEDYIVGLHEVLLRRSLPRGVPYHATIWVQVGEDGRDWVCMGWAQGGEQRGRRIAKDTERSHTCSGEVHQGSIPQQSVAVHQDLGSEQ